MCVLCWSPVCPAQVVFPAFVPYTLGTSPADPHNMVGYKDNGWMDRFNNLCLRARSAFPSISHLYLDTGSYQSLAKMSLSIHISCRYRLWSPQMYGDGSFRRSSDALFFGSARSSDGKSLEHNDSERCSAPLGRHGGQQRQQQEEKKSTLRSLLSSYSILPSSDNSIQH